MKETIEVTDLELKLLNALRQMINGELERVVYYHSGATFIKTANYAYMIEKKEYTPSVVTLD